MYMYVCVLGKIESFILRGWNKLCSIFGGRQARALIGIQIRERLTRTKSKATMLGTTLEGLGNLAPDAAGGTTATTGSTSGRKPKAYGARGKAERKDARRQARRLDQHQRQQAAAAIKNKKQQQGQEEEEKEKQDTQAEDSVGRKAGRSKSSSGRTTTSTLEALASVPVQAAASPKRSSSGHRQPSTKSAKSRGRTIEDDEEEEVEEEESMDDARSNWTEEFESDSEQGSDMEMDQQQHQQRIQPAAEGDDCDADIHNTGEDVDRSTDGDVGSPPIRRTRTKPYARGRNKRTIEEEDDDDDESDEEESSEEGEGVRADDGNHGDAPMSEENETDGSVVHHRADDDEDDREQEEDQSHAQATLGGVLAAAAATPAASRRWAPVLTSPHRRAASATGGASAGRPRSSSRGSRHSHDAGGALALMQVQRHPEEEINEDGEDDEDEEEVGGDARGRATQDSFSFKSEDNLTDPDGGSVNDGLLTQSPDITDDHHGQTKRPLTSKQRVVESPYSTNSRLSDAETFQASTGSSKVKKKKKETASAKKKKVRHYDSDDDYEAEDIERSDQGGDKSGSGAGGQDRTNRRRRRSSRRKQQQENSAWYTRGEETDDDEENEFTDDADDDDGDNVNDGTTSSDESDDELGGGRNGPKDSPPKSAGRKRKETSVTPKADNRSLTQLGRDAKMKKKPKKSSSSASASMNLYRYTNAKADNEDSLSFYSQSLPEVHVAKQPIVSVSKRSRGASGTKKKKVNRVPTTSGRTKTSDTVDDPFMDGDPSADAEKQDPIDEFDESQGIGFLDDNDPPSASGMENANVLADNPAIAAKSPPTDKLGEAGRKRRQRLKNSAGAPFSSPSVLETKTKLHKPTIKWDTGLDRDADADADDTKASSVEKKGRSTRRARASDGGLGDSVLAGHGQHHSPAVHQEDEDSDVGEDDHVGLGGLITQPKEHRGGHRNGTTMSSSGSEGGNDDSEYQDSQQAEKSGQQQPRQKRRRMAGKATEEASTLMTTAGNISDSASPAGRGKHRTPTKRVLATITNRLRSLSRKTSQEEKDITDALKKQADLYKELQEMRSSLQPPNELSLLLKSAESETETTVSTFSSSLNSILSATATMDRQEN